MIKMEADRSKGQVKIEASGTLSDLMKDYALMTASLAAALLETDNSERWCNEVKKQFACACISGVEAGVERCSKRGQEV